MENLRKLSCLIFKFQLVDESSSGFYQESFSYNLDLRQMIFDLPIQQIITRDNVTISVHPMMLVKVTDPVRVAYEVRSLDSFSLDLRPHGGG